MKEPYIDKENTIQTQKSDDEIFIRRLSIQLERRNHFDTTNSKSGVSWLYSESLEIDYDRDLLTIQQNFGPDCVISHQYYVRGGMDSLLQLAQTCMSNANWIESQSFEDNSGICFYTLIAELKNGSEIRHQGIYNRNHIPEEPWLEVINGILEHVEFYGFGQILNTNQFMNARKQSEIKYCSVSFGSSGITYYYQTDDDNICVGDYVSVPFGKNDTQRHGVVEKIGYYQTDSVPFPLDKTKKINKKVDKNAVWQNRSDQPITMENKIRDQGRKKHPAIVRFIGNPEKYKFIKNSSELEVVLDQPLYFDEDGNSLNAGPIFAHEAKLDTIPSEYVHCFTTGKLYLAYFLEFWQGKRSSLHVKTNLDEVTEFNHIKDFEIIRDLDDVLNIREATVRCITHKFDDIGLGLIYGKEYIAIGVTDNQFSDFDYLVMDESTDCYFYSAEYFEIVSDPHELLDQSRGQYVYDWKSIFFDVDSICPVCEEFLFDEPDDFDICPLCGWENDGLQRDQKDYWGGANELSVNESRFVHSLLQNSETQEKMAKILANFGHRRAEIFTQFSGIDYRTNQSEECRRALSQSHNDFVSELDKLLKILQS